MRMQIKKYSTNQSKTLWSEKPTEDNECLARLLDMLLLLHCRLSIFMCEFERGVIVVNREYRESGKTSNLRHHCGRKKITQERDQRRLTRFIKRDKRETLPQIAEDFNAGPSTNVTVRTIQRNIIDIGFRNRSPTSVLLLTKRHKALRLAWAHQIRRWAVDDWKHVAWSNESHFQLNQVDGRVRV
ncbi:HTH_Tnp_Tc3_2 domain-containing protein [Trichonephila clavipes]|nr:HTH_Tnp_Tc3_2 domain-containing protein [Trichonephila clavipes]